MSNGKRISALAGLALAVAMTIPAQAAPPAEGKCPEGYHRVQVNKAKNQEEARKVDKDGNNDQLVCEKHTTGTGTKYADNNMR